MGRFFNDEKALKAFFEKGEVAWKEGISAAELSSNAPVKLGLLTNLAVCLKSMIFGYANFIALRTLELHDALEKRIQELEKQPFAYEGPHETAKVYDKGAFVTHDGSLWHCNYKTASRPGDGPAWTLAVKRGRDAR